MSWSVYGDRFTTADMAGTSPYGQPFQLARNTKVKALRTWFVCYGNPVFTALGFKLYDNFNATTPTPGNLIRTFDKQQTLIEMMADSQPYGLREVYFDFTNPVWLHKLTTYHLVPYMTGYTGTEASHVAWVRGFPDPNIITGTALSTANIGRLPYWFSLIGDDR